MFEALKKLELPRTGFHLMTPLLGLIYFLPCASFVYFALFLTVSLIEVRRKKDKELNDKVVAVGKPFMREEEMRWPNPDTVAMVPTTLGLFILSISLSFWNFWFAICVKTFADPLGRIVGKSIGTIRPIEGNPKTLEGFLTVCLVTFFFCWAFGISKADTILLSLLVGIIEFISLHKPIHLDDNVLIFAVIASILS